MKLIKTLLTLVIIAAVIVAALIALNWKSLLSAQQKLRYGLVFDATNDLAADARANPADAAALSAYAEALAVKGNLGRARYLCDLYGAKSATLESLQPLIEKSQTEKAEGRVFDLTQDPLFEPVAELPVAQALLLGEGLQHALSGDWASAKNHFAEIEPKLLAPELRDWHQYYLARSYRLSGTDEERQQALDSFSTLAASPDETLVARARSNLVSVSLEEPHGEGRALAERMVDAMEEDKQTGWPLQRSKTEYGAFLWSVGEHEGGWRETLEALQLDPVGQSAKAATEQLLEFAAQLKGDFGSARLDDQPDALVELAQSAQEFNLAGQVRGMVSQMKPFVKEPQRAGSLRVALAMLARSSADAKSASALAAEAEKYDKPLAGEIHFQYGELLVDQEQWNAAMGQYASAAALAPERAGEAYFRRYWILKKVQDPLNQAQAIENLQRVTSKYQDSSAYPRAVEELLPLLIFSGNSSAAARICDEVLQLETLTAYPGDPRTLDELHSVANFWKAYLADKAGRGNEADELRSKIPLRHWNYYELITNYPPQPEAWYSAEPELLQSEETAGEFFAGLGLVESAREYFEEHDDEDNQLLLYLSLRANELTRSTADRQWWAAEYLERGWVRELPLLEMALAEAYPRPFHSEVLAAAGERGVPPGLMYAVMKKESNFIPDSVSWAGAVGLMQIMPATARHLKSSYAMSADAARLKDPQTNLHFGAANLRMLFDQLGQDNVRGVIHGHNKGAGNYQKWRAQYPVDAELFTDLVPNEENETFAKRVYRYYLVYDWLENRERQ